MTGIAFMTAGLLLAAAPKRTVVLFLIDGLQPDAARMAADNGAANLKALFDNGVVAEKGYCTSPAPYLRLPDNSLPWGTTSSPNVSVHTGCHLFESRSMDDIFLAAREKGIKSVFAGGAENYEVFTTPDFEYVGNTITDAFVVQKGIDHFKQDGARLIRLHPQRIREAWNGPAGKSNPSSAYIKAIVGVDKLLGDLIQALKDGGVWDSTYLVVAADHGMGETSASDHPPSVHSSWTPFIGFQGPGLKRGETIPYAETPDLGIMAAHFLGLRALKGHTDAKVTISHKGATGTFLANIFAGAPRELNHPRMIDRYLQANNLKPGNEYTHYRSGMLEQLKSYTSVFRGPERIVIHAHGGRLRIASEAALARAEAFGLTGRALRTLTAGPAPMVLRAELPGPR